LNTETIVLYTVITFVYILNPGPAIFVAMTHAVTKNMKVVALSAFASIVGLLLLLVLFYESFRIFPINFVKCVGYLSTFPSISISTILALPPDELATPR